MRGGGLFSGSGFLLRSGLLGSSLFLRRCFFDDGLDDCRDGLRGGGLRRIGIDPLDVGHRSGVAAALAELGDAGVATDAVLGGYGDFLE